MSPAEDRERLIEALRKQCTLKMNVDDVLNIIKTKLDIHKLAFYSNRILIGSDGFSVDASCASFEANIGTFYAIRLGIVLYIPSQEIIDGYYGECGFLVPSLEGKFDVDTVPKRRGAAHFRFSIFSNEPNLCLCIAGYNHPEKEKDSTEYARPIVISSHRWENELKPWLDHWLPS